MEEGEGSPLLYFLQIYTHVKPCTVYCISWHHCLATVSWNIHQSKCVNIVRHVYRKLLLLWPFTRPNVSNFAFLRLLLLQVLLHPLTNVQLRLSNRLKHQSTISIQYNSTRVAELSGHTICDRNNIKEFLSR